MSIADIYKFKPIKPTFPLGRILRESDERFVPPPQRPKRPKAPPLKLIREDGRIPFCPYCGSSVNRAWFGFGRVLGCIQPECVNYHVNRTKRSKIKWIKVFIKTLFT